MINIELVRQSPREWPKVGCESAKYQLKKCVHLLSQIFLHRFQGVSEEWTSPDKRPFKDEV